MADLFVHTAGSIAPLIHSVAILSRVEYLLSYTISGRTAGTITITFGGLTTGAVTNSGSLAGITVSTDELRVTPTSDFNGSCVFSLQIASSCQWANLEGCYEACEEDILSDGLWVKTDPEPCSGTTLVVDTGSEYFNEDEYNQTNPGSTYVVWVYSDVNLFGTIHEVDSSRVVGTEYQNQLSYGGVEGGVRSISFSSTDVYLTPAFTFNVSAIQFSDGPKRTFTPLACFVLGAHFCK